MNKIIIENVSLDKLAQLAQCFASYFLNHSGTIFLSGDLGAGKTTFTQFFAKKLGIMEIVNSPTFNIMKRYQINDDFYLNHFDLYRIHGDIYDLGFEDYFYSDDVNIVEWANYLEQSVELIAKLEINIEIVNEKTRKITLAVSDELEEYVKENENEFIC